MFDTFLHTCFRHRHCGRIRSEQAVTNWEARNTPCVFGNFHTDGPPAARRSPNGTLHTDAVGVPLSVRKMPDRDRTSHTAGRQRSYLSVGDTVHTAYVPCCREVRKKPAFYHKFDTTFRCSISRDNSPPQEDDNQNIGGVQAQREARNKPVAFGKSRKVWASTRAIEKKRLILAADLKDFACSTSNCTCLVGPCKYCATTDRFPRR